MLGLGNFVVSEELKHTYREKELGLMTVIVWGIGAMVMAPFVLPAIKSDTEGMPTERASLIQEENAWRRGSFVQQSSSRDQQRK
jgi:hypothetical protein